jgi:hypothetical protein
LLIGIAALIGGVTALILKWRNGGTKNWSGPVFVTAWGLFWFYLHNFPYVFGHINNLVGAYRDGHIKSSKGRSRYCMNNRRLDTRRETSSL